MEAFYQFRRQTFRKVSRFSVAFFSGRNNAGRERKESNNRYQIYEGTHIIGRDPEWKLSFAFRTSHHTLQHKKIFVQLTKLSFEIPKY